MLFRRNPLALVGVFALAVALAACGGGGGATCEDNCECGDGAVDPGEACDGLDLGGATCLGETGRGGSLACNDDCTLDVAGCTLAGCGNDIIEAGETCDGAALGTRTCATIGYDGGDIGCGADCTYDVSSCCNDTCLAENATMCIGDSLRRCLPSVTGCLDWQITDCAATGEVCETTGATAACACVDRCPTAGDRRCEGPAIETCAVRGDGCLDWTHTTDCTASDRICAVAPSGPLCVPDASAESCADPYPLSAGDNVVAWNAVIADYLIAQPSCNTTTFAGPDLVLSYTATDNGFLRFAMTKPASARQVAVVSSATCGTVSPEAACAADTTPTVIGDELGVTAGTTYHFYVRDTTSGSAPLDNPLFLHLQEVRCADLVVTVSDLSPANATTISNLTPVLTANLDYPARATTGVITITGTLGTNLSFDLATAPENIALTNGGKTLVIDPGIAFRPNEMVTVSWSGLMDASCDRPISPPTWTFQVSGPPCTPGTGGMVGTTMARLATGISSSFSENFVAVDEAADGYVYVGGLSDLFRTPKLGGSSIDVALAVPLTSAHLGYDMLVDGSEIFTLDSNTTATTNQLFRISTTGGTMWAIENYMTLPQTPNDDFRAVTVYGGRIYLTTDEATAGTQIWSVAAASTMLPQTAVLEATLADEDNCSGLALDDDYYYLACGGLDRLIRVDRSTRAITLLTDTIVFGIVKSTVHAHDFDSDGSADALYVQAGAEEVHYVCEPAATGPYWVALLASFGTGTSNYGLAFDRVANTLWMFDDDTREFVSIE